MVAIPPLPRRSIRRSPPPSACPISAKSSPHVARPPSGPDVFCVAGHRTPRAGASDLETLQVLPELGSEIRASERDVDRGAQPPHRRPGVVASPLELVAVDLLLLHERGDPVRQLDLAIGAVLRLLELVEDLWGEDVASDDRE